VSAKVEIIIRVKNSEAKGLLKDTAEGFEEVGEKASRAGAKVKSFGEIATGALRRVGEMGVDALMDAGQAVVSFVGDSIAAAGDYEQSMNLMAEVSGATDEQMAAVKETAKALGADLTLPATSAADAGTAMLELSKAGFTVEQAMAAAKGTLQLAAAAQISEAEAAEIASNALNSFQLAAEEAGFVSDLLAASASASSIEVTDAAASFKMASAVYSSFQGPVVGAKDAIIDMTTAIGILGNAGIKGSDAGTSLKQALLQLAAPSDKAKGLMRDLADRVGEAGDIAYTAGGQMRSLPEILDITARATAGMTQEQRDYYVATIFGADATRSIITLLNAGAEGWDKMRTAVTRQNAAADLAKAQMQGLNGATQGLVSQLETLMLNGLEPLLPIMAANITKAAEFAGSFADDVGPAVEGVIGFVSAAADIIQTAFLPAVSAAGAALIAYAITQIPAVLAALPGLIVQVAAATVAFQAQAAAVLLAAAPFAVIAAAVGGAVLIYQQLDKATKDSTQALLESRPWWNESTAAIQSYGAAVGEAKERLAPYATEIQNIRTQLEFEIQDLAKRDAAGLVSDTQRTAEMAHINALAEALQRSTNNYNAEEQAILRTAAASQTGTARLAEMDAQQATTQEVTQLTAEEFNKLLKQIEETYQKGAEALGSYVETELGFIDSMNTAREDGFNEQFEQQALAYAKQQAAQAAHLGQQLADYTATQVAMGNITREQGGVILQAIEQQYGLAQDASGRAFLEMTAHIDRFAASGSSDINSLASDLGAMTDDAVTAGARMRELERTYTAELVQNFRDGKIDADELARSLRSIPSKVYSEVTVKTVRVDENRSGPSQSRPGQGPEMRATGGPVTKGVPYIVGERGPEVIVPNTSGTVIPNGQAAAAPQVTNVLNYYASSGTSSEADVAQALRMQSILMGA
jgi:TP901 family phage tail tape measure protein